MQKDHIQTVRLETIAKSHQLLGIEKPKHPLFSIQRFEHIEQVSLSERLRLSTNFYQIVLKKDCPGKLQYGQTIYDFDEGVMSFFAPRQVSILEPGEVLARSGWLLNVHPDFIRTSSLGKKMKDYAFFEYAVSEALILSADEETAIETIFLQIEKEYNLPIDTFSQDVVISNIELLLTYCNRYYHRQFITRKASNSELLNKVENVLNIWFTHPDHEGLPTATFLASQLNLSVKYLSDCLKQLTGQTAQQIIHDKLIEHAKDMLSNSALSVAEIAYMLGFDYPQSFNKLFKNKTNQTPVEFRRSFN